VTRLYTDDAAVLAPGAPSAVGITAVRATYTSIFQAIDIDLTFSVAEVKVVSRNWAFLRSTSNGVITNLPNGAQIPSSNQELFVLHKRHGHWKLARYSFSSVLPSAA
jgi:ketosteroid isomerase-like protein